MATFYLLAFIVLFFGVKFQRHGFYSDNLEMEQCNAIKGFFIMMVFISHALLDLGKAGFVFSCHLDSFGMQIRSFFGQLIVVMFLFYSGFGVMESYNKKGQDYLRGFPRKRILATLLNFDIAVLLFVIVDLVIGIRPTLKQVLFSLIAWDSVGNSNWYIFVVLLCYVFFYLGFRLFPNHRVKGLLMVLFAAFVGMIVLFFSKQSWWYDTILCFPAGLVYSNYKEKINGFFKKNYIVMLVASLGVFFAFQFIKFPSILHGFTHNFKSVAFCCLIVLLTMKIKTGNAVLQWLGNNLFPIYIYQRLPMIIIAKTCGNEYVCAFPYVFILACFVVTCILAWGYKYWQVKFV